MYKIIISAWMLLSCFYLKAEDYVGDINFHSPTKGISDSIVEYDQRLVFTDPEAAFVLNIKFMPSLNNNHNAGLGLGVRKPFENGILGFHIFTEYGLLYQTHHFQAGPSLEYLTPFWELRAHSYFPVTDTKKKNELLVSTNTYLDSEILYKTKYLNFAVCPCYDISQEKMGCVAKVIYPFKLFAVVLSGGYDSYYNVHAKLSLKFGMYGENKKSLVHSPVYRSSFIRHEKCKQEKQQDDEIVIIEENVVVEEKKPEAPKTDRDYWERYLEFINNFR